MNSINLKRLIKNLTPPAVADFGRRIIYGAYAGYIWEGVYNNHAEVPVSGRSFCGKGWVADTLSQTRRVMAAPAAGRFFPADVRDENAFLPLLAAVVCEGAGKARILDFGGGLGISYVYLKKAFPESGKVDYHVVELKKMCEEGRSLFEGDGQIRFHDALPAVLEEVDIVYINSAIQYVEDYTGLLKRLCDYRARYLLFVRLAAGDIPTFATAQKNVKGSVIPCWFFNIREILELMRQNGYKCILSGAAGLKYDMDNFPETHRLREQCFLLFSEKRG